MGIYLVAKDVTQGGSILGPGTLLSSPSLMRGHCSMQKQKREPSFLLSFPPSFLARSLDVYKKAQLICLLQLFMIWLSGFFYGNLDAHLFNVRWWVKVHAGQIMSDNIHLKQMADHSHRCLQIFVLFYLIFSVFFHANMLMHQKRQRRHSIIYNNSIWRGRLCCAGTLNGIKSPL